MFTVIKHYFPHIGSTIKSKVSDARDQRGKRYSMDEAVLSVILMFLLKEGSRNSYNQDRAETNFTRNIRRLMKIRLLHGDTFNDILACISEDDLQRLKAMMVKLLISKKVFYPHRHNGSYIVAIDGTGTHSYDEDYSGACLHKTSANGVVSYSQAVLEAKLVTPNGFCISLATAWLENNPDGKHDKQDCELSAFKRLAGRIRELYPRLPITIVGDALYANTPVMDLCLGYGWDYMLVLKEGVLKELNEEIGLRPDKKTYVDKNGKLSWLGQLEWKSHRLSWIKWEDSCNRFSWLTNMEIKDARAGVKAQKAARLRWKIENEGFNTQKNLGYGMEHKYSRIDFNATKNYYQCMQIAHLIEQLALLSKEVRVLFASGATTIIKMSERLRNILVLVRIEFRDILKTVETKSQIRFS
ncbi:MAG: hypothetical protein U5K79_16765 [Cyclobacteriaceae bacterium]|nr:hypothetical protein [Cyclobacteriaceae bacterium]